MKKIILGFILIGLLIISIGLIYFIYYFDLNSDDCSSIVFSEMYSPKKQYISTISVVNCTATSDYATQIILKNNITNTEQIVLSLKGDLSKKCISKWVNELTLINSCELNTNDSMYNQKKNFEAVQISYYNNNILNNEHIIR